MNYSFHPDAEIEFLESIDFLEDERRGLGIDFSVEVFKSIQRIKANPKSWTRVSQSLRRVLVHRFPFGLLYHHDPKLDHIYIVAVMHLHREPGYWKDRLDE